MKILLINPPRWNELAGKHPSIVQKHRGFNPPLGLLYIASSIRKINGHEVEVLDAQPLKFSYGQLAEHIKGRAYDVVGIHAMTFTLIDVCKTVKTIKDIMPHAKTILGGAHVNLFPEETINLDGVDFAFQGEAEFSFSKFLDNFRDPFSYYKIPGLVFKSPDGIAMTNRLESIDDLDKIPFPRRTLLDIDQYDSLLARTSVSTTIVSSRGCPFKCAFCDRPLSSATSRLRFRSAANTVDEICECLETGIKDFLFCDDTFTVDRERVLEICEEILKRKLNIRWDMRTRVDMVDKEMLSLLKRAGCAAIHYGVEAGNDRLLKIIRKGFTIKKVKEAFRLTLKAGIDAVAYFMVGLPSQRLEDIQDMLELARELRPAYATVSVFTPQPGTELYHLGLGKGLIKKDVWREFARDPREGFEIPIWGENFTGKELQRITTKFYRNFYLRPSYIFSRIRKMKTKDEFTKKIKAGISIMAMK